MNLNDDEKRLISMINLKLNIFIDGEKIQGKTYYFNESYLIIISNDNNIKLFNRNCINIQFDYTDEVHKKIIDENSLGLNFDEDFYEEEKNKSEFILNHKELLLYKKYNNFEIFKELLQTKYKNIYSEGSSIIIEDIDLKITFPISNNLRNKIKIYHYPIFEIIENYLN